MIRATMIWLVVAITFSAASQSYKKTSELVKSPQSGSTFTSPTPVVQAPDYMKPSVITEDELSSATGKPAPKKGGFWIGPQSREATPPPGAGLSMRRPENTASLKALFEEMFSVVEKDKAAVDQAGKQLVLPNADTWFTEVFGTANGPELTAEYEKSRQSMEKGFVKLIKGLKGRSQTQVYVVTLRSPSDPEANPVQKKALEAMRNPVPLYSVKFTTPGKPGGFYAYSFAYVSGAFRFVGRMEKIGDPIPEPAEGSQAYTPPSDQPGKTSPRALQPPPDDNSN